MTAGIGVTPTGDTFRVQRQQGEVRVRESFKTQSLADGFSSAVTVAWAAGEHAPSRATYLASVETATTQTPAAVAVPLRLDDLVEAALVSYRKDKDRPDEWIARPRRVWARYGPFFDNCDIRDLTREDVRAFVQHLYDQQLQKSTADKYMQILHMACAYAVRLAIVPGNVAEGLTGRVQDRPRHPRRTRPRALQSDEVKRLSAALAPWMRISVFFMYIGCLRLGETFGLENRDWDPVKQTLRIRRQGGSPAVDGARDPLFPDEADGRLKTRASRRELPMPPVFADVIDKHIADFHGPRPHDPDAAHAWDRTRIISTPESPLPSTQSVEGPLWDRALQEAGLDFDTIGFTVDRRSLRMSGSTVIGVGNLRGKLWSAYLGHKIPAEFGGALMTMQHYFQLPNEELVAVAEHWEGVLRASVGDLTICEEWWTSPHMLIADVATLFGVSRATVSTMLRRGHLAYAPESEVDDWRGKAGLKRIPHRAVVSGPSVHAALERRELMGRVVSFRQCSVELQLAPARVAALVERGLLVEVEVDGHRRVDRDSVDALGDALAAEQSGDGLYVSEVQAARLLGIATHQFIARYADSLESRVTIVGGQRQFLRSAVVKLAEPKQGLKMRAHR